MKIRMPKSRGAQGVNDLQNLIDQPPIIGRALAAQLTLDQEMIELHRRLDGIRDNRIAEFSVDGKANEHGPAMRRGNGGLLKPLQPLEFAQRGIAADDSLQPRSTSRIKFQKVRPPILIESPDLPIRPILQQLAKMRQVAKLLFKFVRRHTFTIHYLQPHIYSSSTV